MPPIDTQPTVSATEQVFEALYGAIVTLRLRPGTKLSEAEIARQLAVSRQPVRDAFFRLSKLGFLQIRPQRGTLVTKIQPAAVLDAAFVRTALEVECCKLAAGRINSSEIRALREFLAAQETAVGESDPDRFHALDEAFHRALCRIGGHAHAWDLILEQKAHMDRVRYLTLSRDRQHEVIAEHARLVDAIAAGDPLAAEDRIRSHLGAIRSDLPRVAASHPEFFDEAPK